jgi:hypothetical protein
MVWKEAWLGIGIDGIEGGCVTVAIYMTFVVHCSSLMAAASTQIMLVEGILLVTVPSFRI